jgi:hypothetical protein
MFLNELPFSITGTPITNSIQDGIPPDTRNIRIVCPSDFSCLFGNCCTKKTKKNKKYNYVLLKC